MRAVLRLLSGTAAGAALLLAFAALPASASMEPSIECADTGGWSCCCSVTDEGMIKSCSCVRIG
jgi:invasion protein IalB